MMMNMNIIHVIALENIPYYLQRLVINIKKKKKKKKKNIFSIPNIIINKDKYTLEELKMKLKILFGCQFIINEIDF